MYTGMYCSTLYVLCMYVYEYIICATICCNRIFHNRNNELFVSRNVGGRIPRNYPAGIPGRNLGPYFGSPKGGP